MSDHLEGLRVLDMSKLLLGSYAALMLAEMGADVVKLEDTKSPNFLRQLPPFAGEESALHLMLNRNKRNIALDLRSTAGQKVALDLVKHFDIVVESFRPGVLRKMGLDYESLKKVNKAVILCSVTGFGQTGTYAHKAGHDLNYHSLTSVVELDDKACNAPHASAAQIIDLAGGSQAAVSAILAAVLKRQRTGLGEHLDVAMADNLICLQPILMERIVSKDKPTERGSLVYCGQYICYNTYETKDHKFVSLAALEPKFFARFCESVDRMELLESQYLPAKESVSAYAELCDLFKSKTKAEWIALLQDVDACFAPVLLPDEVLEDKHFKSRDLFLSSELPDGGKLLQAVTSPVFNRGMKQATLGAKLGEHSNEILLELGYSLDDIEVLKTTKTVL